jgi:hypothetical protein
VRFLAAPIQNTTRPREPRLARLLLAVLFATAPPCLAQPADSFASATAAFEAGDYARALDLFEALRASGVDTAAVNYNLGVCQYRVGKYSEAVQTFARLRERFPSFAAIAEYNRGLALLALGDRDSAREAFTYARNVGDEPLQGLAASALATIAPAATPRASWLGYLDFGAGHDDNVALVDELSLPATISPESSFNELIGYASRRTTGPVPMRLDFSGYFVDYADAPQFSQNSLRVDVAFQWGRDWRVELGPHLSQSWLDGDGFERALGLALRATRPITEHLAFDLRFVYDDLEAPDSRFAYTAGTRERLRLGIDNRGDRYRVRFGYEIESNDRASDNVSPRRDRLVLNLQRRVGDRWSIEGVLAHRRSDYDRLLTRREETLKEVVGAARRSLAKGWLLSAEYRLTDNDSTVVDYSYRSHRYGIAVGKSF